MTPTEPVPGSPRRTIGLILITLAGFAAAYGQAPLYYSNQNQYFLHGLADAGYGQLHADWLANTADPTPIFSGVVAITARFLHPWMFQVDQALLMAGYAAAMLGLFAWLVGPETGRRRWPVFAALLVLAHAALTRWLSYRLFGQDYPWYFQAGVAGQYVLGAMLQPSVFGVLLVAAVCLFVRDRPYLAVVAVAVGATLHSTYLLPAALLTAGFLTALAIDGQPRKALVVGALALALVLPAALYVLLHFAPTSAAAFAEAQDILVNIRIPHHARPDLWLDSIAGLQIAWVFVALTLTWRTQLFPVLAVPTGLAILLTIAQVATGSQSLALLFPWRISAVLVPVATTIVLARIVAMRALPLERTAVRVGSLVLVALLAVAGIWISVERMAFRSPDEELAVMDFVRRSVQAGDVYLLPVKVPNLAPNRGSLSSDFKPVSDKQSDVRVIPINLQRFRLLSGAPIYVDFKSIPYVDTDVIEWRDRLERVQRWRTALRGGQRNVAVAELRAAGVTHLVEPAGHVHKGLGLERVFADDFYEVYRLR